MTTLGRGKTMLLGDRDRSAVFVAQQKNFAFLSVCVSGTQRGIEVMPPFVEDQIR